MLYILSSILYCGRKQRQVVHLYVQSMTLSRDADTDIGISVDQTKIAGLVIGDNGPIYLIQLFKMIKKKKKKKKE